MAPLWDTAAASELQCCIDVCVIKEALRTREKFHQGTTLARCVINSVRLFNIQNGPKISFTVSVIVNYWCCIVLTSKEAFGENQKLHR
jgi:hypothetical protein